MSKHSLFIFSFKQTELFVIKAVAFAMLVVLFCVNVMPQYTQHYTASLIDKTERLKSVRGPKIVLLGDSNVAFGFKSDMIEEAFERPVVNMGLHGGLGQGVLREMAKLDVNDGDIYIYCVGRALDNDEIVDPVLTWITIEDHWDLWRILRKRDSKVMLSSYPTYLKRCLMQYAGGTGNQNPDENGVYRRNAFNEYGDNVAIRESSYYTFEKGYVPFVQDAGIDSINELNKWLNDRNATLLLAAGPIGKGEYTPEKEKFINFQERLEDRVDCPVISNWLDYMFDYDLFYDTDQHLTDKGAILRTSQLIDDLSQWMQETKSVQKGEDEGMVCIDIGEEICYNVLNWQY